LTASQEIFQEVMPAKAGIQNHLEILDSGSGL